MCGISGIINFDLTPVAQSNLQAMAHAMKHRGPNDEGYFTFQHVGLAFVRLSIIDLSSDGHQPMHSPDGRFTLVFNGEI